VTVGSPGVSNAASPDWTNKRTRAFVDGEIESVTKTVLSTASPLLVNGLAAIPEDPDARACGIELLTVIGDGVIVETASFVTVGIDTDTAIAAGVAVPFTAATALTSTPMIDINAEPDALVASTLVSFAVLNSVRSRDPSPCTAPTWVNPEPTAGSFDPEKQYTPAYVPLFAFANAERVAVTGEPVVEPVANCANGVVVFNPCNASTTTVAASVVAAEYVNVIVWLVTGLPPVSAQYISPRI
jgi:hypothetical protein